MKKLITLALLTILVITIKVSAYESPLDYGVRISWNPELSKELWKECETATNQNHCFGVWMSIAKAESNFKWGDHWYFGMVGSKDKSISRRVKSYNKFWFRAENWHFFYGGRGELGKSHYCTSEISSNTKVWCPFWARNFDSFYSEYYKLFIKKDILAKNEDATIAHIQNINAWDEKPKRICREITITIQKWEYLELSFMGRLRRTYRELWANDSLKICHDI